MKYVMQEYGTSLLSVAVALLLFAITFGSDPGQPEGLLSSMKEQTRVQKKEFSQYEDAKAVTVMMARRRPVIVFRDITIETGTKLMAKDCCLAEDEEGRTVKTEFLHAKNPDGTELEITDGRIFCRLPGIYQITVRAADQNGAVTVKDFSVPVKRRI